MFISETPIHSQNDHISNRIWIYQTFVEWLKIELAAIGLKIKHDENIHTHIFPPNCVHGIECSNEWLLCILYLCFIDLCHAYEWKMHGDIFYTYDFHCKRIAVNFVIHTRMCVRVRVCCVEYMHTQQAIERASELMTVPIAIALTDFFPMKHMCMRIENIKAISRKRNKTRSSFRWCIIYTNVQLLMSGTNIYIRTRVLRVWCHISNGIYFVCAPHTQYIWPIPKLISVYSVHSFTSCIIHTFVGRLYQHVFHSTPATHIEQKF